jgi:uncharacterized membrane protein
MPENPGPAARLDPARVHRLAGELAELEHRLALARTELLSWPVGAPPEAPAEPPPEAPVEPPPVEPPSVELPAGVLSRGEPGAEEPDGTGTGAAAGPAGEPAAARRIPWRELDLLAWVGGAVTLCGVGLFLALAAGRGWFGPPARLVAGAVLGLVLLALAVRVRRRSGRGPGRAGALALAATGIAALYLDLGAATVGYRYLPVPLGLVLGLLLAGGGLALAGRWRAQPLACGVLLGADLLMPYTLHDTPGRSIPLLVGLVLVPQLAAAPLVRAHGWAVLAVLAAVFPVGYAAPAVLQAALSQSADQRLAATLATAAVFLVGLVTVLVPAGRVPAAGSAVRLLAAPVPLLAIALVWSGGRGALLAGAVAVVLLAPLGVRARWAAYRPLLLTSGSAGLVALFQATALWLHGGTLTGVLLGQATALALLAARLRRPGPLLGTLGYGVIGLAMALDRDLRWAALTRFPAAPGPSALVTALVVALLVLALGVSALLGLVRAGLVDPAHPLAPAVRGLGLPVVAVTALYGAAGAVLTAVLLVAPTRTGFLAGHALITVSWTVAALVLLALGVTRPGPRIAGALLVVAAVAKLALFDLVMLDGLARVAAFVGAGLVLLAAGNRYARRVARATGTPDATVPAEQTDPAAGGGRTVTDVENGEQGGPRSRP